MSGSRTPLAGRMCREWVRFYTRKLPESDAQRRRMEIESDLHEHMVDTQLAGVGLPRLNAEILARVLVGVPADLSWRRTVRREPSMPLIQGGIAMSPPKTTQRRILYWLSGVVVLYAFVLPLVAGTLSIFVDWDDEPGVGSKLFLFGIPMLSAVLLVTGLAMQSRDARRGLPLIIAGAAGPSIWFWMLPLYAPLMIAVIALAVSTTPRKRNRIVAA